MNGKLHPAPGVYQVARKYPLGDEELSPQGAQLLRAPAIWVLRAEEGGAGDERGSHGVPGGS